MRQGARVPGRSCLIWETSDVRASMLPHASSSDLARACFSSAAVAFRMFPCVFHATCPSKGCCTTPSASLNI